MWKIDGNCWVLLTAAYCWSGRTEMWKTVEDETKVRTAESGLTVIRKCGNVHYAEFTMLETTGNPTPLSVFLPGLYLFMRAIWDSGIIWILACMYEPARWYVGVLWQPCLGRMIPCFESKKHYNIVWPPPFSIFRFCRRWSGMSRRGDRDWGASWSRSSTQWPWPAEDHPAPPSPPSLHSSSPSVSLPRSSHQDNKQNSNPQQYDRRTAKRTEAVHCNMGGVRQRWAGLCTLTCVCVCVCVRLQPHNGVWAGVCVRDWDTGHFHTCIHGETCQLTAFDYCGCWCLLFAWFWFQKFCRDEAMVWKETMRSLERNSIYGIISRMDQSVMSRWRRAL